MNDDYLARFIETFPYGCAYQRIITDEGDKATDYEFIAANQLFGDLFSIDSKLLSNRKASEVFVNDPEHILNRMDLLGSVALNSRREEFELHSTTTNKWYKVVVFSPETGFFTTLLTDITTEKEQLSEYENFFKVNLSLLCIADTNGNFIKVNKEWERILGFKQEELEHRKFLDFVHPDDLEQTLEAMSRLANQEQVLNFINRYLCKDGSYRFVEWRSQPYGTTIYAAALDITEKIEQQQELQTQTALLTSLLDSIPDLVFYRNIEGIYLGCNPKFSEYIGKDREMIVGHTDYDIFPKDTADYIRETDLLVLETNKPFHFEKEFNTINGGKIYLDTVKAPFVDSNGKTIGIMGISRDVTLQKQAEQALRESEENFRNFFASMNDMIVVGNYKGEIFYTNDTLSAKTGYSKEELRNMNILELNPANKRTEAEAIFSDMFEGKIDLCPLPIVRKDGSIIQVETRAWFGKWDGEDCIFGIIKDLSKEQESLQKFNKIFNNNPALMAITDINNDGTRGTIVDINQTFLEKLGFTKEEIIGKTARELELFEDIRTHQLVADELLNKGKITNIELKVRKKTGELIDGLFSGDTIESQGRKYFLTVMIDISDRKKAERAIEYQVRFQKMITEISSDFVGVNIYNIDRKLKQMLKIIGQFFDVDITYIFRIDKKKSLFIKTHEWASIQAILDNSYTDNKSVELPTDKMQWWRREITTRDFVYIPDTKEMPKEALEERQSLSSPDSKSILLLPISNYQGLMGFIGMESIKENRIWDSSQIDLLHVLANTLADAYTKVAAEEELITAKENAEKANRSKSDFLANMSHEIRTPLNAITGFAEVLLEKDLGAEHKEFINIIKNSGKHLLEIINNILDLSKIEAGKMEIDCSTFNISRMIKEVTSFIQPEITKKGLKLQILVDDSIPHNLIGDYRQIKQILLNLVSNAVKFTQYGKVSVTLSESDLLQAPESHFPLQITVSDTGIGIPAQQIDNIFEPFDRGLPSVERSFQGTGLGLTITKQLTELMKGKITVTSEENKGATFSVHLPLEIDLNASDEEVSPETDEIKESKEETTGPKLEYEHVETIEDKTIKVATKHILLVEDNEINQKLVKTFLRHQDYQIDSARNGAEGIIKMFEKKYDIVLMDIQMPILSGDKAIKILRSTPLFTYTPILALTAHAMKGDDEKAIALGFSGYIAKPMVKNQLIETVYEYANQKFGVSSNKTATRKIEPDIIELLPGYIDNISDSIKTLEIFMENDNLIEIGKIAHKIKGSGSCFGLAELSIISEELEKSAITFNIETSRMLIDLLGVVMNGIKSEFGEDF